MIKWTIYWKVSNSSLIHCKHVVFFIWLKLKYLAGFQGGKNVIIEPHRHAGVFIARGKEDALVTLNMVPGEAVYGEKRITVEVSFENIKLHNKIYDE